MAAFDGTVVAQNDGLVARPELLMSDPFGEGWMLVVRPAADDWQAGLVPGATIGSAMEAWIARGSYKDRTG